MSPTDPFNYTFPKYIEDCAIQEFAKMQARDKKPILEAEREAFIKGFVAGAFFMTKDTFRKPQ